MKTATQTTLLCLLGAILILGSQTLTADDASADTLRLELVKSRSGRMDQDRAPSVSKGRVEVVRVSGELSYSRGHGLRINGMPVLLSANTGMFPAAAYRLPSPRSLSGRSVTLYGVESPMGIRVRMIIDHDASESSFSSTSFGGSYPETGQPGPDPHARTLSPDNPS